jgi:hypothetical protein
MPTMLVGDWRFGYDEGKRDAADPPVSEQI